MMTRREAKGLLSTYKDRLEEVRRFYLHLAGYLSANTLFFTLNVTQGPDGPVALIPIVLWGALLFVHGRRVFGWKGKKRKEWEERVIYELMHGEEMPEEHAALAQAIEKLKLAAPAGDDTARLLRRLENLEAIVTSQGWEEERREAMPQLEDTASR